MKKLLTLILAGVLCVTTGLFVACGGGNDDDPPTPPAEPFVEQDLAYGVSFANTSWADSDELLEITVCEDSEARIYTNTDTNAEIVNGLKFTQIFSAEDYADAIAEDSIIGALLCPLNEIEDLLQFEDNDKIVDIKLFEKANGTVSVNAFVQKGDVYELACHVRDFPADGSKNALDIGCVFYVKVGTDVFYGERIDSTLEVAALNSLNSGAYGATTAATLSGLVVSDTCTLTLDANGGTAAASVKAIKGALLADVVANVEAAKADMQFVKWQIVKVVEDVEVYEDYNEETFINEDMTLKAVFTSPYIATAEDFMAAMNAGGGSYTFTADIDLTETLAAAPWAGESYIGSFVGDLDGDGHKLTGITGQSDGQTACYGFISTLGGTISNLYIELDVKYPAWNGNGFGTHPFGTLAHFFRAEMSNCVISLSQSLESGWTDLNNVGLFSYFCAEASLDNVLIIDRTTDSCLTQSALFTSVVAGGHYELDINNVVYVKENGISSFTNLMPVLNTQYESPAKAINNFYLVESITDAAKEGAGYVLTSDYIASDEYNNGADIWTANTDVALDCLDVVSIVEDKVMFGEIVVGTIAQAVSTAEELYAALNSTSGSYYLTNDIDMYELMETEGYLWGADKTGAAPTCAIPEFGGILDGKNFKITGIHGEDGGNGNYGLINRLTGTIKNCFIEITAKHCDWQGSYGLHSFGTLAQILIGEVSNCVINVKLSKNGGGSNYHHSLGLFAYLQEGAVLKNVLVIDDSTDAFMEFAPLICSYAALAPEGEPSNIFTDVEDVVFIRTNLGITVSYPAFMNGFYRLLPCFKSTGIQDLYLADSFEEAIAENGSYTLSDAFYDEANTDPNSESYWVKSGTAMDCLNGITYAEGVVKLNGRAVYVVED